MDNHRSRKQPGCNGDEGNTELETTTATTSANPFEGACSPALFASGEHIKAIDEDNETNGSDGEGDRCDMPTIITGSDAQSTRSYGSPPSYAKYFNSEDRRSSNNETLSVPMTAFPSSDGSSSTSGVSGSGSSDYCSRYVGSDEDLPNFILTTKFKQPNKPNLPAFYEQPTAGTSPPSKSRGLNLESNKYSNAADTLDGKPHYTSSDKASIAYIYPPPIPSQVDDTDASPGDKRSNLPKGRSDGTKPNSQHISF
jgi:hypothetical protein